MSHLLEEALKLPVAERIRLADELYMSVQGATGSVPLSDAQIKELERRLADHERHPDQGISLEQFRERFNAR